MQKYIRQISDFLDSVFQTHYFHIVVGLVLFYFALINFEESKKLISNGVLIILWIIFSIGILRSSRLSKLSQNKRVMLTVFILIIFAVFEFGLYSLNDPIIHTRSQPSLLMRYRNDSLLIDNKGDRNIHFWGIQFADQPILWTDQDARSIILPNSSIENDGVDQKTLVEKFKNNNWDRILVKLYVRDEYKNEYLVTYKMWLESSNDKTTVNFQHIDVQEFHWSKELNLGGK